MLVQLNPQEAEVLVREVMQSYPEYSTPYLVCTSYDYDKGIYEFLDEEEDKSYTLEIEKLKVAVNLLLQFVGEGKLPGIARSILPDVMDAGNWDADCTDALVQVAIFGEVIYG